MEQERLRKAIEATLLGPRATREAVERLADEAVEGALCGVCIPQVWVPMVADRVSGTAVRVVTVANFPFGDLDPSVVRAEIAAACGAGAHEVDVVAPVALASQNERAEVERYLSTVFHDLDQCTTKLILETAALQPDQIRHLVEVASTVGCRWVKTSTGFHPAGGASLEAIRLLREAAPVGMGVKMSGGVRSQEFALAGMNAGADRIGTSSPAVLLGASESAPENQY